MAVIGWQEPIGTIAALLRPAVALPLRTADAAPDRAGAYVLVLELGQPLQCVLAGQSARFEPGCYIYAGSAYGPGGIRARLARHLREDKKVHWHVDRLTMAASAIQAIALEGASECGIVARLAGSPAFAPALAGFGSSDCRTCRTHLLRWLGERKSAGIVPAGLRGHG